MANAVTHIGFSVDDLELLRHDILRFIAVIGETQTEETRDLFVLLEQKIRTWHTADGKGLPLS